MTAYARQYRAAAANYDNQSPPEPVEGMGAQELYERLCEGDPIWLADAVQHAVCNNDLPYLIRQVSRHTGWQA